MNVIENVSHSIYSVARMYGGCTINGKEYLYHPIKDILIKSSYMAEWVKLNPSSKRIKRKPKDVSQQKHLF